MSNPIETLYTRFLSSAGISTDTRKIIPGTIFFALKGENFNGNTFALNALQQGAAFAVVDEDVNPADERILKVDNVLQTLQNLATHHRLQFDTAVVAITGSNGKTTTKELVAAVLQKKYNTLFTQGNLNNHIGVPLTLLQLTTKHQMAVIEMGANHQGEIALLCQIAMPTHGLITNVGKAHLEGFGGFEGVIKGKTEMYSHLMQHKGNVFCSADNEHLKPLVQDYSPVIYYGSGDDCFFCGKIVSEKPFLSIEWEKKGTGKKTSAQTNLTGAYNFENVLAAARIGNYFGVPDEEIKNAIENYVPSNQRSQVITLGSNTIILDAYNANPTSMIAALDNLQQNYAGKKIIILGDMYELGHASAAEHKNVIEKIKSLAADKIILVGNEFKKADDTENIAIHFTASAEAFDYFKANPVTGATILIKGSRKSEMEKVLPAFAETA